MKKKFFRILAVGLSLVLALALAGPVVADVNDIVVDVDPDEISVAGEYTIGFRINSELVEADDPTITVRFPDDTDIDDLVDGDIAISVTSGIGSDAGTVTTLHISDLDTDDIAVEIELDDLGPIGAQIGDMAYVQVVISNHVVNPSEPGDYTLEVQTSEEDTYIESASYEIVLPVVGGGVYVYNAKDVLVETYGGSDALDDCFDDGFFEDDDFTIEVGPGTYVLEVDLDITGEGLTLISGNGAEDTIIDADGFSININADEVTIDGFTIDDAVNGILINAADVVIKNNIITDATTAGISIGGGDLDAIVEDNVIEDCADGIILDNRDAAVTVAPGAFDLADVDDAFTITANLAGDTATLTITTGSVAVVLSGAGTYVDATGVITFAAALEEAVVTATAAATTGTWARTGLPAAAISADVGSIDATISGNEITEASNDGGIVFDGGNDGNTISGNTITANEVDGIHFRDGAVCDDNLIDGNDISANEANGINLTSNIAPTELVISGNDITDNEDDGILIEEWSVTSAVSFNTITGNEDDGIDNNDADNDVDAAFNWWGGDESSTEGEVNDEPLLTGTAATVFTATDTAVNDDDLDAQDEVGVRVSGVSEDVGALVADVIRAGRYAANPEDALAGAVAFFDVYVFLHDGFDQEDVTVKVRLYDAAITEDAVAYFWTGDFWSECSEQLARAGLVSVDIAEDTTPDIDELEGTAFAVVGEAAEAEEWVCPQCGLKFDTAAELEAHWEAVHAAAAAPPQITVQAPPAPTVTVQAPPPAPAPQVVIQAAPAPDVTVQIPEITLPEITLPEITVEAAPAPSVTVEAAPAPSVTVEAPTAAAAPAIPSYLLWVIIAIGAVLVIALIVLIVRTRRVA